MPAMLIGSGGPAMAAIAMGASLPVPDLTKVKKHPPVEWVDTVGDFLFHAILLQKGEVGEQHKHEHDHVTIIASGSGRLWVNGVWQGDYKAFNAVEVKKGNMHIWQALDDNTRLACCFIADKVDKGD